MRRSIGGDGVVRGAWRAAVCAVVVLAWVSVFEPASAQAPEEPTAGPSLGGGTVSPMAGDCDGEDPPEDPTPCQYYRCTATGWRLYYRATGAACDDSVDCTYNTQCNSSHACVGGSTVSCSAAQCLACNNTSTCAAIPGCTIPAATPTFSPGSGSYTSVQSITISDATAGATIRYTTDGSTPTTSSPQYTGPVSVSSSKTLKAIATASGYGTSAVGTATYVINLPAAATPTFSPGAGEYPSARSVTISSTTPGASIRYTMDGSTPTAASPAYTGPVVVSSNKTLKAIAVATNYSPSAVGSASYTIAAPAPTLSPATGTYTSIQSVTISCAVAGASIFYTTDGSTPTASSPQYTGPVSVSSSRTLKAIATAPGYGTSAIGTATYVINLPAAATPTFSPPAGTYAYESVPIGVTLASATPGASIHYTLDGAPPTTGSALYTGPVTILANRTLKAIAVAPNYSTSAVGSAPFTVVAATPMFVPAAGSYASAQSVYIMSPTPATSIYYTTDGSVPTTNSTPFTGLVDVSNNQTLKAIAVGPENLTSAVGSASYTIAAATPTFEPGTGTYTSSQSVTISCATAGATIHYTTDGSTPTTSSPQHTGPIVVSSSMTLRAIATAPGSGASAVASASYTIDLPDAATPVFSPAGGTYASARLVTISDATSGATVHFTTDGSSPSVGSPVYSDPVLVATSQTLKALAVAVNHDPSEVAIASYTILQPDLELSGLWNSDRITTGGTFTGHYTITNTGAGDAAASHTCFYLSTSGTVEPLNHIGSDDVPALASGTSLLRAYSFQLPSGYSGTYQLVAHANCDSGVPESDTTNNAELGTPVNVVPDVEPPLISVVSPVQGESVSSLEVAVTVVASDDSGVASVNVGGTALTTQNGVTWTGVIPLGIEGQNVLDVSAEDLGGFSGTIAVLVNRDTVPPLLSSLSPSTGTTVQNPQVRVSGHVEDSSTVALVVDGHSANANQDGEFEIWLDLEVGANGISIVASDRAGNLSEAILEVTREGMPFVLDVSQPRNRFEVSTAEPYSFVEVRGTISGGEPPINLTVNGVATPVQADGGFDTFAIVSSDDPWIQVQAIDGWDRISYMYAAGVTAMVSGGGASNDVCQVGPGETHIIYDAIGNWTSVTSLDSDPDNCGCLGHRCEDGTMACIGGRCGYPDGQGGFIDTDTSVDNCGAIGNTCGAPPRGTATCSDGVCGVLCEAEYVPAGAECVDLTSDPRHCGYKFFRCPGVDEGDAVCTNGVCGRDERPAVMAVNGVTAPGDGVTAPNLAFRNGWASGMRLTGSGLEKVTSIELEDWGADTVGLPPDEVESIPVFSGDVRPVGFVAEPNQIVIPIDWDYIPLAHWQMARLHYVLHDVEETLLVEVGVSFWDVTLPPPEVSSIETVRLLGIDALPDIYNIDYYNPWSGFLKTRFDPTLLDPPPRAILGSNPVVSAQLWTDYPIKGMTRNGIYVRAGLSPNEIISYATRHSSRVSYGPEGEWYPVVRIVTVHGPDDVVRVGVPSGYSELQNALVLTGNNLPCRGRYAEPAALVSVADGLVTGMQEADGCTSGRMIVELAQAAEGRVSGDAILRVGDSPPHWTSSAPLHFAGGSSVSTFGGVPVSPTPLDVYWGTTYRVVGVNLGSVLGVEGPGGWPLRFQHVDSNTIDLTLVSSGATLCVDTSPVHVALKFSSTECPLNALSVYDGVGHFSVEDGYTVEFWTALEASVVAAACSSTHDASDVVLAIRGLPRCPPPPPPEAPPEAPSAPSEGGSTQLPDNPVGGEGDGTNGWGLP